MWFCLCIYLPFHYFQIFRINPIYQYRTLFIHYSVTFRNRRYSEKWIVIFSSLHSVKFKDSTNFSQIIKKTKTSNINILFKMKEWNDVKKKKPLFWIKNKKLLFCYTLLYVLFFYKYIFIHYLYSVSKCPQTFINI